VSSGAHENIYGEISLFCRFPHSLMHALSHGLHQSNLSMPHTHIQLYSCTFPIMHNAPVLARTCVVPYLNAVVSNPVPCLSMVAVITCSIPRLCFYHHPYLVELRDVHKKRVFRHVGLKRRVVRRVKLKRQVVRPMRKSLQVSEFMGK
jgi:hypothetical protein